MEVKEIDDEDSHITDGSFNEERNRRDYEEINRVAKEGNLYFDDENTKGLTYCRLCDIDEKRIKQRKARWVAKPLFSATKIEYCLSTAFMQCLSNAPNVIHPEVTHHGVQYLIQQRIVSEKNRPTNQKADDIRARRELLTWVHGLDDRNDNNLFKNIHDKYVNIDFDNVRDNYAYNPDFLEVPKILSDQKVGSENLLTVAERIPQLDYEKFLTIYNYYIDTFEFNKQEALNTLQAFIKRAKKYKEQLIQVCKKGIETQKDKKEIFKKILDLSKEDLKNFNDFIKKHNFIQTNECCVKRFFKNLWKKLKGFFFGTRFANNNEAQKNLSTGNSCENQR